MEELSVIKKMPVSLDSDKQVQWFVMRDLKRANAKQPAYKLFDERNIRAFTPMTWRIVVEEGKRVRKQVPFIPDLLFVHENRENLDPIVARTTTLQYRWLRNTWREPMTVSDAAMSRFIKAVTSSDSHKYYLPEEVTPVMYGRKIRIIGGPLDGYEGSLITRRGSKVRRLLIEIPNLIAVGVEVRPEYIQFVE